MRTKRNLVLLALGGIAGYVVGRHPEEVYEKVRSTAGVTAGLARDRAGKISGSAFHLGRSGVHRAPTEQPPETGDDVIDRTSTAYVSRAHP